MRSLVKTPLAVAIIIWHIASTWVGRFFLRSDIMRLRKFYFSQVARHARWMAAVLQLEVIIENPENARAGQNYLIVGNHMSYLDAVILPTFLRTSFITSMEMRAAPVLGLITELGGCLYVDRRSKENIHREIEGIVEALKQGFNVVVFPEATSTDGTRVLGFKRPLFAAAPAALKPVLPVVIQYEEINGKPVTKQNRDYLCWYGDMEFGSHFLKLTTLRSVRVRLKILAEIPVTESTTRDTLMDEAFARISGHYRPIT